MALAGSLDNVVETKSPADKVYSILKIQHHKLPNVCPDKIHTVDVHEGDWETHGSVKLWTYTLDGKVETFKEKVEMDDMNKTVTLIALEGHCLDLYKSYKVTFVVTPKGDGSSCSVKITIYYEKINENIPAPNSYLEFCVNVVKDIDAHLLKSA